MSHGYITYQIQAQRELPENTLIENTASIYFDFNPPIITNTTQNILVSELPKITSTNPPFVDQSIQVYPNPFGEFITIDQILFSASPTLFSIYDATGRTIISTYLQSNRQQLSTAHFKKGLYFYRVVNEAGQIIGNGKIVKP